VTYLYRVLDASDTLSAPSHSLAPPFDLIKIFSSLSCALSGCWNRGRSGEATAPWRPRPLVAPVARQAKRNHMLILSDHQIRWGFGLTRGCTETAAARLPKVSSAKLGDSMTHGSRGYHPMPLCPGRRDRLGLKWSGGRFDAGWTLFDAWSPLGARLLHHTVPIQRPSCLHW